MCGIIGYAGADSNTLDVLMNGLSGLEYRGYDSAGVAIANGTIDVVKREGELDNLETALESTSQLKGPVGIGHTRWSTHGPPSDENAHPHMGQDRRVAIVHNGIIENYTDLRSELRATGHSFKSETDTEVIPHLIEYYLDEGLTNEDAFRAAVQRLTGSYAIAAVFSGDDAVLATRQDSPLVVGVGDHGQYLASDVPAFREYTDKVIYMNDGEFAKLSEGGVEVTNAEGTVLDKTVDTIAWEPDDAAKSGYEHYMKKEIHEQPRSIRKGTRGRIDEAAGTVSLEALDELGEFSDVQFVACGTSYHAALYGVQALQSIGVPAQAFVASEYATGVPPLSDGTLVIGVTQSGETADTLSALRRADRHGARTLAVTNVVGSTVARECDHTLYIRAGPEISVAATKSFASQLVAQLLFVLRTSEERNPRWDRGMNARETISALRDLPDKIQEILDTSDAERVAKEIVDSKAYFFIGRGQHYPVALEGALKMKEITYKHAEGFAAGELKHGPLALVSEETPVFAIVTGDGELARKTIGNVKEVEARSAPVVAVTDGKSEVGQYADYTLEIPVAEELIAPVLANVQLQLVSYFVANEMGRSIDKPRNLAKSVTVE